MIELNTNDFFLPRPMEVYLNPEATRVLMEARCSFGGNRRHGWKWGPQYRFFMPSGEVPGGRRPEITQWAQAVEIAVREQLIIYNGRTHKVCRPVWAPQVRERTLANLHFAPVQVHLHGETYHSFNHGRKVVNGEVLTWV